MFFVTCAGMATSNANELWLFPDYEKCILRDEDRPLFRSGDSLEKRFAIREAFASSRLIACDSVLSMKATDEVLQRAFPLRDDRGPMSRLEIAAAVSVFKNGARFYAYHLLRNMGGE
jgi:hypothetical protein